MIFVTVGNWHAGFDRLVKAMDKFIEDGVVHEEVVMQIGSGTYRPQKAVWFEYCTPDQCEVYIQQSRVVISHAGMGTIATATRFAKPAIVVPRQKQLGEIYDDHQFHTVRQLLLEKKVLVAYDVLEIPERLHEAESFVPAKTENSGSLINTIKDYLEMLQSTKDNDD